MIGTPRYDFTTVPTPCRSISSNCSALLSRSGSLEARIRDVRPSPRGIGARGAGLPRSVRNGKSMTPVSRSSNATYTMSARNVVSSCWPVRLISRSRSSCEAAAWPTSLTIASSLARWRVSPTRRAFSRATLRLAARVVSNRSSDSLKALVRSRFWREMPPRTSEPAMSGAKRPDAGSRDSGTWPRSAIQASKSSTRKDDLVASICRQSRLPSIGASELARRMPRSIMYGY